MSDLRNEKFRQQDNKKISASLGTGIGLRTAHLEEILNARPEIGFFEVLADNFIDGGALPLRHIESLREQYPLTLHSVGMSLGGSDPLDEDYLVKIAALHRRLKTTFVSDHLCWTSMHGVNLHELLPLPFTEEAVRHVAARIRRVQDILETQIAIENVSSYLNFQDSTLSEGEFIAAIAQEADCSILLDVNNLYINSKNLGLSLENYFREIPWEHVCQIHLGGFEDRGEYLLDSHSAMVAPEVWDLFRQIVEFSGPVASIIEWDNNLPELSLVVEEAHKAKGILP